jgi:hypothetical protein
MQKFFFTLLFLLIAQNSFLNASPKVLISKPSFTDKYYTSPINLVGIAYDTDLLLINGKEVELNTHSFNTEISFNAIGSQEITIVAINNEFKKFKKKFTFKIIPKFNDAKKHYAVKHIGIAASEHVISGYKGSKFFRPNFPFTRAELANTLLSLNNIDPNEHLFSFQFADLQTNHWSYPYIQTALEYDLISPQDQEHFGPEGYISRVEFLHSIKKQLKPFLRTPLKSFSDVPNNFYAKNLIEQLTDNNIVPDNWIDTDLFQPNKQISRGEAAYILGNIFLNNKTTLANQAPKFLTRTQHFALEPCYGSNCYYLRLNPNLNIEANFMKIILHIPEPLTLYLSDNGEGPDQFSSDHTFSTLFSSSWNFANNKTLYSYKLYSPENDQIYTESGEITQQENRFILIPNPNENNSLANIF